MKINHFSLFYYSKIISHLLSYFPLLFSPYITCLQNTLLNNKEALSGHDDNESSDLIVVDATHPNQSSLKSDHIMMKKINSSEEIQVVSSSATRRTTRTTSEEEEIVCDETEEISLDTSCISLRFATPTTSNDHEKEEECQCNFTSHATATSSCSNFGDEELLKPSCCSICMEPFKFDDDVVKSKNVDCNHVFHMDCIFTWLMKHDECPMCRREYLCGAIEDGGEEDEEREQDVEEDEENLRRNDDTTPIRNVSTD